MAMKSSNTKTSKGALHNGRMPNSSTGVAAGASAAYGRGKPVKPEGSPQVGYRMDIPGQSK